MNQKELNELRRRFKPDRTAISKVYGCYVSSSRQIISYVDAPLGLLSQEEQEMYLNLLKKTLSGALGRNLIDIVFSTAQVADGITFVEAGVLSMLEGYTVDRNPELDVNRIDITTPNNDPMVKAAYQIREDSGMAFGMRSDNAEVATLFQLPEDTFEQAICFTSMNTTPDIMVLAKLADGADETAVKEALEAHRQSQHDTFSWYLAQNLPKVEDARILVEDGYVFYLIAENADAGEAAFHAYVEAQA